MANERWHDTMNMPDNNTIEVWTSNDDDLITLHTEYDEWVSFDLTPADAKLLAAMLERAAERKRSSASETKNKKGTSVCETGP